MFPKDIAGIIAEYAAEYELLDWIDQKKLIWHYLSHNPSAIDLLRANPDKIEWRQLSYNPNAIELLRENPDKIEWRQLSYNPSAIGLLRENPDKIDWIRLPTYIGRCIKKS
jgi:ribosomal protein L24E